MPIEKYMEDGAERCLVKRFLSEKVNRTELAMFENNTPEGLIRMKIGTFGKELEVRYVVSGLIPLSDAVREDNADEMLERVIRRISETGRIFRSYFLSVNRMSLLPEEIFTDSITGNITFLYLPVKEENFQQSLQRLMEYFLRRLNPREESRVLLLYGMYQKSLEPTVTSDTLYGLLNSAGGYQCVSGEKTDAAEGFTEGAREDFGVTQRLGAGTFPEIFPEETTRLDLSLSRLPEPAESPFSEDFQQDEVYREPYSSQIKGFLVKHKGDLLIAAVIIIGIILFILI